MRVYFMTFFVRLIIRPQRIFASDDGGEGGGVQNLCILTWPKNFRHPLTFPNVHLYTHPPPSVGGRVRGVHFLPTQLSSPPSSFSIRGGGGGPQRTLMCH